MKKAKKITAAQLRKKIDRYFDEITYTRPLMEQVATEEKDKYGHWVFEERQVENRRGEPVELILFTKPPWKGDLYLRLGIHRSTWSRWKEDEELGPVCEYAELRFESYWASRLESKYAAGAKTMLSSHFGWSEAQTVHVTGGVEEYLQKLEVEGSGEQEF